MIGMLSGDCLGVAASLLGSVQSRANERQLLFLANVR